ncbi:MAG TPA: hypothetical protein VGR21_01850 [Cryptosporangiaceae bacterium]|nr:hypothetical protein [Cryptosporangiaceae bacterium]
MPQEPETTWRAATIPPPGLATGRELRPGRGWYVAALALALAGLLAGAYVFASNVGSLSSSLPRFLGVSNAEAPVNVDLRAGQRYVLYTDNIAVEPECRGIGQNGGAVTITPTSLPGFSFVRDGDVWDAVKEVRASADGRYQITCVGDGYGGEFGYETYAVGEYAEQQGLTGDLLLSSLVFVGLALAGLTAGVLTALVILACRVSHKRRLVRQGGTVGPVWPG